MSVDNTQMPPTKVFAGEQLVRIQIRVDDPDKTANWKSDVRSDATYEGAEYGGTASNSDDDAFTVVIPKADVRRWERASVSNGADIEVEDAPMEGSFALPKLTFQ
jgi:hypothetical protein